MSTIDCIALGGFHRRSLPKSVLALIHKLIFLSLKGTIHGILIICDSVKNHWYREMNKQCLHITGTFAPLK